MSEPIYTFLNCCSTAHGEVVDDSPESTMFVVKGFTAIHMKLDHILIVATDGYPERGLAAKAATEPRRSASPPQTTALPICISRFLFLLFLAVLRNNPSTPPLPT